MKKYWLVGRGNLWLGDNCYTQSHRTAKKFESQEQAEEFAFDGRPKIGDCFIQYFENHTSGFIVRCPLNGSNAAHLGKKATSVMDDPKLLKISVKKFG